MSSSPDAARVAELEKERDRLARNHASCWEREQKLAVALESAEKALDEIARLVGDNADDLGWQTDVHRIACEAWRQVKDVLDAKR